MSSQERKNSFGKIISFTIIVIIIFTAFYMFITKDNTPEKEDTHDTAIQEIQENAENEEVLGVQSETNSESESSIVTSFDREIYIYNDKNFNGQKDDGEMFCDICVAKYLNGAQLKNGTTYPPYTDFTSFPVASGGVISEDDVTTVNHVWGYFDDREVIIPHTDIFLGDSTNDIHIPAWEYSLEISGTNAMLKKGEVISTSVNEYKVKYTLSDLVPILKQKFESQTDIYVYFIPDETNLDIGYLVKSHIKESDELGTYFIELNWPFAAPNQDALNPERLSLIML